MNGDGIWSDLLSFYHSVAPAFLLLLIAFACVIYTVGREIFLVKLLACLNRVSQSDTLRDIEKVLSTLHFTAIVPFVFVALLAISLVVVGDFSHWVGRILPGSMDLSWSPRDLFHEYKDIDNKVIVLRHSKEHGIVEKEVTQNYYQHYKWKGKAFFQDNRADYDFKNNSRRYEVLYGGISFLIILLLIQVLFKRTGFLWFRLTNIRRTLLVLIILFFVLLNYRLKWEREVERTISSNITATANLMAKELNGKIPADDYAAFRELISTAEAEHEPTVFWLSRHIEPITKRVFNYSKRQLGG